MLFTADVSPLAEAESETTWFQQACDVKKTLLKNRKHTAYKLLYLSQEESIVEEVENAQGRCLHCQ